MSKIPKRKQRRAEYRQAITGEASLRVELLRERIYATLALLAVLLTIDPAHTSPAKAAVVTGGTALSLWAASIIAGRLSYRVVMQRDQPPSQVNQQYLRHAPLLAAAFLPLLCIGLAFIHVLSLAWAINISIGLLCLLLFSWSLLSARPVKADIFTTLIIAGVELAIVAAVVGLKRVVGH